MINILYHFYLIPMQIQEFQFQEIFQSLNLFDRLTFTKQFGAINIFFKPTDSIVVFVINVFCRILLNLILELTATAI